MDYTDDTDRHNKYTKVCNYHFDECKKKYIIHTKSKCATGQQDDVLFSSENNMFNGVNFNN